MSYRRDDSPGYVSRLEDELERVFGAGRVFRDATDIPGGTQWKNVIDANLHSSAALLLIIGPRWEQIWHARMDDDVNYVALELQRAHELNVPIIPVTLDGTQLSKGLDLGSISFIYENQFHDISDRQGRWRGDFERLVSLLESVPGIGTARTGDTATAQPAKAGGKSGRKWLSAIAGMLIVAAVFFGMNAEVDNPIAIPSQPVPSPALPDKTIFVQNDHSTDTAANASAGSQLPAETDQNSVAADIPDINGTWVGRDGTMYFVQQNNDGTFAVESPGYASGQGRFFTNMPRKYEVEMFGVGRGEFSVSTTGDTAMGWIIIDGQQQFDTMTRVK